MKIKDLKTKSAGELSKLLIEKREAIRALRFGGAGSKSKNVRESRNTKKAVAQIMTLMKAASTK